MNSLAAKILFYYTLVMGTAFVLFSFYMISRTNRTILPVPDAPIVVQPNKNTPPTNINSALSDEDLVKFVGTNRLLDDSRLKWLIKPTESHFAFNQVLSNSGDKIAYAELSDCAGQISLHGNNEQACSWDYSVKVFNTVSKKTTTLYSEIGTDNRLHGVELIFSPFAWTKNDKKIILTWSNIGNGGSGGMPPEYSFLDANGGAIENPSGMQGCFATLIDSNQKAITSSSSIYGASCGEETPFSDQILLTNMETGKTTVIRQEKDRILDIVSFNKLTRVLTYTSRGCQKDDQACGQPSDPTEITKQVKIPQ